MIKRLLQDEQPSELSLYVIREFARQYNATQKQVSNGLYIRNLTLS